MKLKAIIICFIITVLICVSATLFIYYWVCKAAYNAFKSEQADRRAYLHIDDSIKVAQFLQRKECREKRFAYHMTHDELLYKYAEMIAAEEWNERNTQDLYHNQSPEVKAVLRANKMSIARKMTTEFIGWFDNGYATRVLTSMSAMQGKQMAGLIP